MSTKQSTKQSTKKKSSTSQTGSSSTGDVTKKSKKKETKTRTGSFSKGVTSKKAEPVDVAKLTTSMDFLKEIHKTLAAYDTGVFENLVHCDAFKNLALEINAQREGATKNGRLHTLITQKTTRKNNASTDLEELEGNRRREQETVDSSAKTMGKKTTKLRTKQIDDHYEPLIKGLKADIKGISENITTLSSSIVPQSPAGLVRVSDVMTAAGFGDTVQRKNVYDVFFGNPDVDAAAAYPIAFPYVDTFYRGFGILPSPENLDYLILRRKLNKIKAEEKWSKYCLEFSTVKTLGLLLFVVNASAAAINTMKKIYEKAKDEKVWFPQIEANHKAAEKANARAAF